MATRTVFRASDLATVRRVCANDACHMVAEFPVLSTQRAAWGRKQWPPMLCSYCSKPYPQREAVSKLLAALMELQDSDDGQEVVEFVVNAGV